jgi:trans-aconitate 2-methyltransferase
VSWDPTRYLEYEDARLRPALELLARIRFDAPRHVVDLGCGAGNVARHLASRWPNARIEGVDGDDAMLERARRATAAEARFTWSRCDIGRWSPEAPVDVLFSNAALHWLDDHAALFPRLLAEVGEGGTLAVQMPDNFGAPSHRALQEVACGPRWRDRLAGRVRAAPVAGMARYFEWLAPQAARLDLWTTEYLQWLPVRDDGEHPVVGWMRGTALLPFVGALGPGESAEFIAEYARHVERHYPRLRDGSVLFPFRRIFVVAERRGSASR